MLHCDSHRAGCRLRRDRRDAVLPARYVPELFRRRCTGGGNPAASGAVGPAVVGSHWACYDLDLRLAPGAAGHAAESDRGTAPDDGYSDPSPAGPDQCADRAALRLYRDPGGEEFQTKPAPIPRHGPLLVYESGAVSLGFGFFLVSQTGREQRDAAGWL